MYRMIAAARAAARRYPGLGALALMAAAASAAANAPLPQTPAADQTLTRPAAAPPATLVELDTPVEQRRITSPFGWRIHPILRLRRFHQGVDFGAPEGTPVHAAEDGVVESIGRRGHYGLYLRIRHCATVETAYAHLARFAAGLRPGSAVRRGEVIAQVGRTGWATGPHLFYQVIVGGRPVDPDQAGLLVPVDRLPESGAAGQPVLGGAP